MATKTTLWRVEGDDLRRVAPSTPPTEQTLENWVADDPSILGLDVLVIDRQVQTEFGGRIDLLAIDASGGLTVLELKRDRTPRDVVAQLIDYASWVNGLTTRKIHEMAAEYLQRPLYTAFADRFGTGIPEVLNNSHNMVLVAIEADPSTQRIVEYLNGEHGISINTAFFSYFTDGETDYLAADWLMDQDDVIDRAEEQTQPPWSGYYYVNAGHDETRSWEDMRRFGFIAAGGGRIYSMRLNQLSVGDPFFVYQKGRGYIGYGIVTRTAVLAKDFEISDGRKLEDLDLEQPNIFHHPDDAELADYLVGVEWKKTFPLEEGRWKEGGFANQNIVCKLRHRPTLDFLFAEFDVDDTN